MAAPLRVGILNDMNAGPPGGDVEHWLRLCADDLVKAGRIDREVEFVHAWGLGLPTGTAGAVERAFAALAEQDVLMIVGPAVGDNALVATPLAERFKIPTLNWAGAERARGEYMFHLQVGSHEDESLLLARHFARLGARRIGVVYDRSPIGKRHLQYLQDEAEILGLSVQAQSISPLAEIGACELDPLFAQLDGFLYLGLGLAGPSVAYALKAKAWPGPRAMNTAGIRGYEPDFGAQIDGWVYVDMISDHNKTLTAFAARIDDAGASKFALAKGYDLGRLVAEALAKAPEVTREGVKHGLEQIKWLPAAEGQDGVLLGFGKQDRGALHGRYLVLREWLDGQSIELQQP